jgi:hypothetical protein
MYEVCGCYCCGYGCPPPFLAHEQLEGLLLLLLLVLPLPLLWVLLSMVPLRLMLLLLLLLLLLLWWLVIFKVPVIRVPDR